ncbi:MAG: hypothetical protein RLZZ528_2925 [Pseudomonadota bacterium]
MSDDDDSGVGSALIRVLATLLVLIGAVGFGIYSALSQNGVFRAVKYLWDTTTLVAHELPNHLEVGPPAEYTRPGRQPGSGVTIDKTGGDGKLILLSSFFGDRPGLRLVTRDGTVLAEWRASFTEETPDTEPFRGHFPRTDLNVDIHGMQMEPDGSVIFNFEYAGTVKKDRCGKTEWTLVEPTHHSIDRAEGGGYWIPSRRHFPQDPTDPENQFPPFTDVRTPIDFASDEFLKVSATGETLARKQVMRVLLDNGLEPIMTATGQNFYPDQYGRYELVHLNKITELKPSMATAFPMFEAGDLLFSIRDSNLLAVVDPDTWKIKWHQLGPFLRQHDPEFMPDGTISVFNNNAYVTSLGPNQSFKPDAPFVSEVMNIDPKNGATRTVYGNRPGQEILTVIRGKIDPTPEGGYMVTEFEGGRAFEIDKDGQIIWEYINRYDDTLIYELSEALVFPADYFTVKDWSCPAQ